MKHCILLFCLSLLFFNCSSSKETNPLEIPWIKKYMASVQETPFPTKVVITEYTYNNQTVYVVNGCYGCADSVSHVYTKNQEEICVIGSMIPNSNTCPDFFDKATNKKVLWKSFSE